MIILYCTIAFIGYVFISVFFYIILERKSPSVNSRELFWAKFLSAVWPLSLIVCMIINIILLFNVILRKVIK